MSGDLNSLLRLSLIIRGKGGPSDAASNEGVRVKAMKVLLLSVEHEEHEEIEDPVQAAATFPAHLLWLHRLGGLVPMWSLMLMGITKESSTELRALTCQWIEKIFLTLPLPLDQLTASFVTANGIPLLVDCLDHPDVMEVAAKALVEVVLGDIAGVAFVSQEPLVLHILDLVTCAEAPLQVCLSKVLIHIVVAVPSTLRMLLDAGILFVFVSLLQCNHMELKGSALVLIATVLRGVVGQGSGDDQSTAEGGSVLAMMGSILRSIINIDVVTGLVSVLPLDAQKIIANATESGSDGHPLELAKRALMVLEILSSYTYSRLAMYNHVTALARICATLSTAADLLTGVSSVHDGRGSAAKLRESVIVHSVHDMENLDSIAALCLKIITNISLSQIVADKEEFTHRCPFLESAVRIAAFYPVQEDVAEEPSEMTDHDRRLSRVTDPSSHPTPKESVFPLTIFEAIDLLSVYSVYTGFGQLVEESGPSTALALVDLACRAVTYLSKPQRGGTVEMSGTIRSTHVLSSVMLITYTLYHTYTAAYSIPRELCAAPLRSDEFHPLDMKLGDGADKEIFEVVANCHSLLASVTELLRDINKSSHASRLLQVVAATPYPSVLVALWRHMDSCHVIPALIDCGTSREENVNNIENSLLALGTLAGAPALFPWECALLAQRVNAVMHDISTGENGDIDIDTHTALMDPRSKSLMISAQVRAQQRIDPRKSASATRSSWGTDTGDDTLDWELRTRQRESERLMRKDLCGLVPRLVIPSLCCMREGMRVVGAMDLL